MVGQRLIIVGSGVSGLSLAVTLKRLNPHLCICLLSDSRPPSSRASIGLMPVLFQGAPISQLAHLKVHAFQKWPEWADFLAKLTGIYNWFEVNPWIFEFEHHEDFYRRVKRVCVESVIEEGRAFSLKPQARVHPEIYLRVLEKAIDKMDIAIEWVSRPLNLQDLIGKANEESSAVVVCPGNVDPDWGPLRHAYGWTWKFPYPLLAHETPQWVVRRWESSSVQLTCSFWPDATFLSCTGEEPVSLEGLSYFLQQVSSQWSLKYQLNDIQKVHGMRVWQPGFFPVGRLLQQNGSYPIYLLTGFHKSGFLLSSIMNDILKQVLPNLYRAVCERDQ